MLVLVGGTSSGKASTAPARLVVQPGQAQGPRPSPHPPLVPTGEAAFPPVPNSVVKILQAQQAEGLNYEMHELRIATFTFTDEYELSAMRYCGRL